MDEYDLYIVRSTIPIAFRDEAKLPRRSDVIRKDRFLARALDRWRDWRERRAVDRGDRSLDIAERLKALRVR
jgi:hypothetical protein